MRRQKPIELAGPTNPHPIQSHSPSSKSGTFSTPRPHANHDVSALLPRDAHQILYGYHPRRTSM